MSGYRAGLRDARNAHNAELERLRTIADKATQAHETLTRPEIWATLDSDAKRAVTFLGYAVNA